MASLVTHCNYAPTSPPEPQDCSVANAENRALPLGPRRDHFLAIAGPDSVSRMKAADPTGTLFNRADYGRSYSALTSYPTGAVWTWLVHRVDTPTIIAYNDI
jgi:hypothetical protein